MRVEESFARTAGEGFEMVKGKSKKSKLFHVYAISAYDGKIHHWKVEGKNADDAREIFEATEDDNDTEFILLTRPIKGIVEHDTAITAEDIGE